MAYSVTQYQRGGANTLPQFVASPTGTNYYFGGKLVKNSTGYVTPGRLGSIGKYFPYGQERPSATQDGKEKFATYFRTSLDYADQRYEQPGMGRFMTPDRMVGNLRDPASFNKYAYGSGDPINGFDPTGDRTWCVDNANGDGQTCHYEPDDASLPDPTPMSEVCFSHPFACGYGSNQQVSIQAAQARQYPCGRGNHLFPPEHWNSIIRSHKRDHRCETAVRL